MGLRRTLATTLLLLGAPLAAPTSGQEVFVRAGTGVCSTDARPVSYRGSRYAARRPGIRAATYGTRGRRAYGHAPVWIPGRYEVVLRHVWVRGESRRFWDEPRYELRADACGNSIRVLVRQGAWHEAWHPGRHETRRVRIWRPAHWS